MKVHIKSHLVAWNKFVMRKERRKERFNENFMLNDVHGETLASALICSRSNVGKSAQQIQESTSESDDVGLSS